MRNFSEVSASKKSTGSLKSTPQSNLNKVAIIKNSQNRNSNNSFLMTALEAEEEETITDTEPVAKI